MGADVSASLLLVHGDDDFGIDAESQHGGLVRFDKRTGQRMGIQPQPGKGEPSLRWNWDSPTGACRDK